MGGGLWGPEYRVSGVGCRGRDENAADCSNARKPVPQNLEPSTQNPVFVPYPLSPTTYHPR
jgi:hypothetical protein